MPTHLVVDSPCGPLTLVAEGDALRGLYMHQQRHRPADQAFGERSAGAEVFDRPRAVGLANGKNPISIVVPCHRVIGSTGSLTGYGGGLERKEYLLGFERRRPTSREAASTG